MAAATADGSSLAHRRDSDTGTAALHKRVPTSGAGGCMLVGWAWALCAASPSRNVRTPPTLIPTRIGHGHVTRTCAHSDRVLLASLSDVHRSFKLIAPAILIRVWHCGHRVTAPLAVFVLFQRHDENFKLKDPALTQLRSGLSGC